MAAVRVRFAPSPTGHLHIGSLRGALFNWYFARQKGGAFLIRIEDTDLERSKAEYTHSILKAFEWCGITSDEPLVFQSQRLTLYQEYMEKLVTSGCGYWSDEPDEEGKIGRVLKYRVPVDEVIEFADTVRGLVTFHTKDIEDFIVVRSDGTPLYNFVVVVDDIEMSISHVIRGEEHLSNTARQLLLYRAFGVSAPQFAHLPLILGSDGRKLSKRDSATAVIDYKKMGFLASALCNYLMRLGWSHGDQEIFTCEELTRYFNLENVHPAGAMFDMQKLRWMNGVYIKHMESPALKDAIESAGIPLEVGAWSQEQVHICIDIYKERAETLGELAELCNVLAKGPSEYDTSSDACQEFVIPYLHVLQHLKGKILSYHGVWSTHEIKNLCGECIHEQNVVLSALLKSLRFALTASFSSPAVYTLAALLGAKEVVNRITRLLDQESA